MYMQQSLMFAGGANAPPSINTIANTATGLTPSIPAHSAGQLIVLLTGSDGTSLSRSSNTGVWNTELILGSGSAMRGGVFTCLADGTNMSITLSSTGSTTLNHIIYIVDNVDTVDSVANTGGPASYIYPKSLTISAGSNRDVLWIVYGWLGGTIWTATTAPTGFTDMKTRVRSSPPRWGMASASLIETGVQTKSPYIFQPSVNSTWYSATLGIYKT